MGYRKNLMTGLIGLALFATPVIAAAQDHDGGKHDSHQSQSDSNNNSAPSHPEHGAAHFNAPAHNNGQSMAPRHEEANENRHEQRAERTFNAAPAVETRRDVREDRREDRRANRQEATAERRDFREDRREAVAARQDFREDRHEGRWEGRDNDDHRGWNREHPDYDYDNDRRWGPYYTGGPYYLMPEGYAGGACGWARHLRAVYLHDRYTGHPAAAADLLPRVHRAERACGLRYGYNGYYSGYRYFGY